MRQTTSKEIANKLSLYYTTVSKTLRGHSDISVETKHHVLSLAKEFDYHPITSIRRLQQLHSLHINSVRLQPGLSLDGLKIREVKWNLRQKSSKLN